MNERRFGKPVYTRLEPELLKKIKELGFTNLSEFLRFAAKRTIAELQKIERVKLKNNE